MFRKSRLDQAPAAEDHVGRFLAGCRMEGDRIQNRRIGVPLLVSEAGLLRENGLEHLPTVLISRCLMEY